MQKRAAMKIAVLAYLDKAKECWMMRTADLAA